MTSPYVVTVLRPLSKKPSLNHPSRSIRRISQQYFQAESIRTLAAELLIFVIFAGIAIWPILQVMGAIRALLL
jgi:hypothetical protein